MSSVKIPLVKKKFVPLWIICLNYRHKSTLDRKQGTTMDWSNFRFIDLFAGTGWIRLGFEAVGGHCVFSSEFDEAACKTYEANFGEHPSGDITKINAKDIPDFDVLLGGFPCQAFSIIWKKNGLKMKLVALFSLI